MSGYGAHTYEEVESAYCCLVEDMEDNADVAGATSMYVTGSRRLSMDDVRDLEQRAADIHHRASELRIMAARCGLRGLA